MRVVFDTNIFISALVIPRGQAETAIFKIIEGTDTLVISRAILDEILSVLANKFHREIESLSHTALFISEIVEMVKPKEKMHVFKDEPDNRVLECAIEGKADIIVTGDKEILRLKEYKGVKIVALSDYLND